MAHFRRLYRIILILFWFFIMTFYALFIRFCCGKGGIEATKRLSKAARVWGAGLTRILNIQVKLYGNTNNVKGLIVSNHLSYMDILVTASTFPLRFTPKAEISKWPFLGWFIGISDPIWIDRNSRQSSKKTLNEFIETLKNEINLIIFPEGTTTDSKVELLPFKSTTFEAAAKGQLPIYPILLHYKEDDDHIISWFGDATLLPHVWKVIGMKKIEAEVHILDPIISHGKNRKEFSHAAHEAMNSEYKKLYLS